MALHNRLVAGIRALVGKTRTERELDEELREHLNAAIEQKMSRGMTREDATRAARAEMGSVAAVKDDVRDTGWELVAVLLSAVAALACWLPAHRATKVDPLIAVRAK